MKSVLPALSSLLLASLLLCPLRSAAIDPGTAQGLAESRTLDYRVEFSAPLFSEPAITADLKGSATGQPQGMEQSRAPGRRLALR
jgi:hypothetical protein